MPLDFNRTRPLLQGCQFRELFVEHLGWEACRQKLSLKAGDRDHALAAVAEKRGFVVWLCESTDSKLPDRATRLKLDRALSQTTFEHLIVFVPADKSCQSWLWVRREPGRPLRAITHDYSRNQPGDSLLQKLQLLFVSLEEEESGLSVTEISGRVRAAFNVERVTKRFYEDFKKQHAAFLAFIDGISEVADREWYASVMLNRLMFVYFIQRKGFLDGDPEYLRNRLNRCQREKGKDKFYSFYRYFLLRLFHEGLGGKQRPVELEKLLGRIPYLNGGMFDKHVMEERHGDKIQIPDKAFERIFDYFDQYQWHLDERPLRADNEINPDVLGYIFEKYINQKQMGAYYTKEDITEYIGKNTILPFLFDAARKECRIAFESPFGVPPSGGSGTPHRFSCADVPSPDRLKAGLQTISPTVWDLLRESPDRYIYPAVRHGADKRLPDDIAAGVKDVSKRTGWNKPAPGEFALPTEIWREVVARRTRCEEIRKKLAAGEVRDINDLITLNLNIRQFAQDVIENCEGPELLRAFWHAIEKLTALDLTCGSGAFLFAALNILEPLYEACLDRMEAFLEDEAAKVDKAKLKFTKHGYALLPGGKFEDFSQTLDRVASHPNPKYFIYKSIILNNLFGVDIMEEAVEICKLRLFLKLAAQIEPDAKKENLGIEPLPDIDFNICAGNTLVGYATLDEVQNSMFGRNYLERIRKADEQIRRFRNRQSQAGDLAEQREDKQQIRALLAEIREKLDISLFTDYGARELTAWKKSHQPFHWYVEYNSIIQSGGFDVIVGNPPWKEYSAVKKAYTVRSYVTEPSGNLYALCTERALAMLAPRGYLSFIVQLPIVSSSRMDTMRDFLRRGASFIATITCDDRPGKLFDGLQNCRSTIFVLQRRVGASSLRLWSSGYRRWASSVRDCLFPVTAFVEVSDGDIQQGQFPKVASPLQASAYAKLFVSKNRSLGLAANDRTTNDFVFYQESSRYWVKATVGLPYYAKNCRVGAPAHGRHLFFSDARRATIACAILHSSLFYTYFIAYGDCFHVSDTLATNFPVPPAVLEDKNLESLGAKLMRDLELNAEKKTINTKDGDKIAYDEFRVGESKPILDEIDRVLARHYGFTAEELDFIMNYDIKYRLGRDTENEEES